MDVRRHSSRDDEQLEYDVLVLRLYAFTTRASRISPPPRVSVSPCLPVLVSPPPRVDIRHFKYLWSALARGMGNFISSILSSAQV